MAYSLEAVVQTVDTAMANNKLEARTRQLAHGSDRFLRSLAMRGTSIEFHQIMDIHYSQWGLTVLRPIMTGVGNTSSGSQHERQIWIPNDNALVFHEADSRSRRPDIPIGKTSGVDALRGARLATDALSFDDTEHDLLAHLNAYMDQVPADLVGETPVSRYAAPPLASEGEGATIYQFTRRAA